MVWSQLPRDNLNNLRDEQYRHRNTEARRPRIKKERTYQFLLKCAIFLAYFNVESAIVRIDSTFESE